MQKFFVLVFHSILSFLSKVSHKKLLYVNPATSNQMDAMAVYESKNKFWYVGNLYDTADISYGIANEGTIYNEIDFVIGLLQRINKKSITFYDIGANTGIFGILALAMPEKNIYSHFFEPLSEHTSCIKRSLYMNRYEERGMIHQIGLGNENTEKTFYIAGSGSSLISSFSGSNAKDTCTISVKKLSDYQKEKGFEFPDFVKIDVEGNEYDVIEGGISVFGESRPVLYVEIAKDLKNIGRDFTNPNFDKIFSLLTDMKYSSFRVSDDYKKVIRFIPQPEESGVHMYLFLHPDNHTSIISHYVD